MFETPVMAFGCVATKQFERGYIIQIKPRGRQTSGTLCCPLDFQSGIWTIQRTGSELSLSVGKDRESTQDSEDCPRNQCQFVGIHVGVPDKSRGTVRRSTCSSEFLYSAIRCYAYKEAPVSFWNWWTFFCDRPICQLDLFGWSSSNTPAHGRA